MKKIPLRKENRVLIENCFIASSFFTRFMGLMGKSHLDKLEALLFPKCNSIHTFFMRFPIDVVLISQSGKVTEIVESMQPWRFLPPKWNAKHVLEMAAHSAKDLGIKVGDQLECEGVFA